MENRKLRSQQGLRPRRRQEVEKAPGGKKTAGPSTTLRSGRDDNFCCARKSFSDRYSTPATELSSRPEKSGASGPPKVMRNGSCSATTLLGRAIFPLVIPTGAQRSGGTCGSAVPSWECFSTGAKRSGTCGFSPWVYRGAISAQTRPGWHRRWPPPPGSVAHRGPVPAAHRPGWQQ
jgi:hypothetical protein